VTEQFLNPARTSERELVLRIYPGQIVFAVLLSLAAALGWLYFATQREIIVAVNGQPLALRTHQQSLGALLAESGFKLNAADVVQPPLDTPLDRAEHIQVWLAQPVEVEVDGQVLHIFTQSGSVDDTLRSLNIKLGREDRLWFGDGYLSVNTLFSQLHPTPLDPRAERAPIRLSVQRSVPIDISDDGVATTIFTNAPTVGEVLRENDILVHPNDRISPALKQTISAGLRIAIERSKPLTIQADGKTIAAHTREQTIGKVLSAEGIKLQGKDYTKPPVTALVLDNMQVQVVRVREDMVEEASAIPYAKVLAPDDELEIDQQQLKQPGKNGEHRKLIRVVYENDTEVNRVVEKEWDARAPTPQITSYGRKIVVREMMTPNGPIQYWRVARMYATSYSPIRSGTPQDKPWYGHTSSGLPAGKGVIAVDKSVVPWLSRLFVLGYGIGIAGDTGGGVRGKLIDLGFDDDNYESWHQWIDVYWLAPAPPPDAIRWMLPNMPLERQRQ
jgi:resuscitation-promoting factor RpfB